MSSLNTRGLLRTKAVLAALLLLSVLALRSLHELSEHGFGQHRADSQDHQDHLPSEKDCAICQFAMLPFIPSDEVIIVFPESNVYGQIDVPYSIGLLIQNRCMSIDSRGPPSAL